MKKLLPVLLAAAAVTLLCGADAYTDGAEPTNDLPNPFRTIEPWGKLPEGRGNS